MSELLIVADHAIHDNVQNNFVVTGDVDPVTGEHKVRAISRVTQPGQLVSLPEADARWLIDRGATHEPDQQEIQLYRLSTGDLHNVG